MIGTHELDPSQSKVLAEYAAFCISKDESIIEKLAEMHSLEPINYLRRNMRYILPYLLGGIQGNIQLQSFASMLDMSVRSLCEQGAHHLLVAFLMTDDQLFAERGFDRMRDIFLSDDAPQELLSTRQNKVISLLAMELGVPGKMEKVFWCYGFMCMTKKINHMHCLGSTSFTNGHAMAQAPCYHIIGRPFVTILPWHFAQDCCIHIRET